MNLQNDEWTLEEARKHWKPMTRAVQHVGVPGYTFQAAVLWDGSIVIGPIEFRELEVMKRETAPLGPNRLHLSVAYGPRMSFPDRYGTGQGSIRRRLEQGRLPIPHLEIRDSGVVWHETVWAHLLGRPFEAGMSPQTDDLLVVEARWRARSDARSPLKAHLWLYFGDTSQTWLGYKCRVGEELDRALPHTYESPYGLLESQVRYVLPFPRQGHLRWHDRVKPEGAGQGHTERVLEWEVSLAGEEEAEIALILPYAVIDRDRAGKLAAMDPSGGYEEVVGAWKRLLDGPGQILTPDAFVNDYAAAVAGQMAQQVSCRRQTKVWKYKTSPNHYEGYWPCNAAKALPAFDLRGLTCLSRPVLQSFIETQTADVGALGADRRRENRGTTVSGEGFEARPGFLGNFGEWTANTLLLSHGLELWALAAHFRVTRDGRWLGEGPKSPLQAILDACDWLTAQRNRTRREETGSRVAHWGLLPAASAHDWLSGNTIFNDAFCIFGLIEAVRMLRETGHPRAGDLAGDLAEYRACLRERYIEARNRARPLPLPGGSLIPYVPRDVYELDWAKVDWTYTGYGPLRAGAWGALDPHDELVDQALRFLEAGLPRGEGCPIRLRDAITDANWREVSDPEAPRHYLWKHYVEYETMWPIGVDLFLQRDDLPRFFECLFHNLAVVLHREWRVGVESLNGVPSCAPGEAERWLALRKMFVNERGGYDGSPQSLWLLQAIPRCWLQPGHRLSVKEMGTHLGGRVDLDLEMSRGQDTVRVSAHLALAIQPAEIRLRLRSGRGNARLASARINGVPAAILEGDTIRLPAVTSGRYEAIGHFEPMV
ncbi:MAG: hypothetical protein HYU36_15710 [Planctomycetes bacterium]|nr:hypothetical protein [Planctomycetota bacterium]